MYIYIIIYISVHPIQFDISLAARGLEAVLAAKSPKVKGPMKQVLIFSTAAWEHRWKMM